ncbi:oligosaccharide flippase family protein [uncultured Sphaerotilus sp.]|uniref:lipopolysaccharide biosynthesis protein n=1 Tax=uncultured Sphaerotilus sp. TaxID=474984 RepID=UPI0030CA3E41
MKSLSVTRSLALTGLGSGARLFSSFVSIGVTARCLGPGEFGALMFALTLATLLVVPANFGLSTYVLRTVAQASGDADVVVSDAMSARWLAVGLSTPLFLAALLMLPAILSRTLFGLLLLAMLAEGFSEFYISALRARGHYGEDARLGVETAWLYSLPVGLTAWATASVDAVALAYLLSRLVMAVRCRRVLSATGMHASWTGARSAWTRLRSCRAYATDYAMTAMFGQVDGIVLNHYLGAVAVGVHQAGMRLFMAAAQIGPILANVFLPRVASAAIHRTADLHAESFRLQLTFVLVGAVVGLAFSLGASVLVGLAFGPQYQELVRLMPWFGLLFQVRFAAAAWGITLTSRGQQTFRAAASVGHWILVLVLAAALVPAFAAKGWLMALVIGNTVLWIAYAGRIIGCSGVGQAGGGAVVVVVALVMMLPQGFLLAR